jgi:queuosine precursor transporter
MIQKMLADKPTRLLMFFSAFFVANALIAECVGNKLFSLERVFGFTPHPFTLLGEHGLTFTLSCGSILWPLEFVMTDIVNEYYGPKVVRRISLIAVGLLCYAFVALYASIQLPPDTNFWTGSQVAAGVPDMQTAFANIFGQGMWIIMGSLTAFLVSQVLDVWIFHKIKKITGEKHVWLRATGSTIVSQLIDSFIVLFIAFKIGKGWSYQRILALGLIGYTYKFTMAVILTPLIYLIEKWIEHYFGPETTLRMKNAAMGKDNE